jgi:hypothetical protein
MSSRPAIPQAVRIAVLTEAGYRCAVPTCRGILALDLHHIVEVAEGGAHDAHNLLVLCPTCHALFTRGTIDRRSIELWKGMLVALGHAFDIPAIDQLVFLNNLPLGQLQISGDGVLQFARLIGAGLAEFHLTMRNGPLILYEVRLTFRGRALVSAWQAGDRTALQSALGPVSGGH